MFRFLTWSDTNQAVQLQKMARGLKFWIKKVKGLDCVCSENKALISFAVTAKLICVFVFAYAKRWFSHDAAHLFLIHQGHNYVYQDCGITSDNVYHKLRQNEFHSGS